MARGPDQPRRRGGRVARGQGRGGNGGGGRGQASGGKHRAAGLNKHAEKKGKIVSIKNRIRSIERLLKKDLVDSARSVQEGRLAELRAMAEEHDKGELERAMALRYRRVKFFERRKIERRIRRVEQQMRGGVGVEGGGGAGGGEGGVGGAELNRQLTQLKEDLEYIKFFPKTERYVSLFRGEEDKDVVKKREELRRLVKENIAKAQAEGQELEETGSEEDGLLDMSEDDFFLASNETSDEEADDEWDDDTSREQNAPQSPLNHSASVSNAHADISSRPLRGSGAQGGRGGGGNDGGREARMGAGGGMGGRGGAGRGGRRGVRVGRGMERMENGGNEGVKERGRGRQHQENGEAARALMPPPQPRLRQDPSGGSGGSSGLEKQRIGPLGASEKGKRLENVEGKSEQPNEEEGKKKRKRSRPKKKG